MKEIEDNHQLVMYLDPNKYTNKEMEEIVKKQLNMFKSKKSHISYKLNEYGIYIVTIQFEDKRKAKKIEKQNIKKQKRQIKEELQREKQRQKNLKEEKEKLELLQKIEMKQQQKQEKKARRKLKADNLSKKYVNCLEEFRFSLPSFSNRNFSNVQNLAYLTSQEVDINIKNIKDEIKEEFQNIKNSVSFVNNKRVNYTKKNKSKIFNLSRTSNDESKAKQKPKRVAKRKQEGKSKQEEKKVQEILCEDLKENEINEEYRLNKKESYQKNYSTKKENKMEDIQTIFNNDSKALEESQIFEGYALGNLQEALKKSNSNKKESASFSKVVDNKESTNYEQYNPFLNVNQKKEEDTKFKLIDKFNNMIEKSIEKQRQKDEIKKKNTSDQNNKLYGNYKQTRTFKPL